MNFKVHLKILFIAVLLIEAHYVSYSQTICGIDVSSPDSTAGFVYNNSLDAAGTDVYVKTDPGMFDRVLLNKGLGFVCTVNYPTANRFVEIYDSLVSTIGYENDIKDVIPQNVQEDDIIAICILISEGKAQIIRYWYEKKYNVKLNYDQKNMELYISYF